jgi:hypothetical protein
VAKKKNPIASRLDISEIQGNSPIILDPYSESHDNNILTYKGNKEKVPISNSSHSKKTSITMSSVFLWKI